MKLLITITILTLCSFSLLGQNEYLIGKWQFEKIPEHVEIDEEGIEMSKMFFKDFSLSFNQSEYNLQMMGSLDSGKWSIVEDNTFKLDSNNGTTFTIEINKLNETQIIFNFNDSELQLLKLNDSAEIISETNSLNKASGIVIDQDLLIGSWNHNGQTKNGVKTGFILNHQENELANYSFFESGEFINKAPFGIVLGGTWSISEDEKTLSIKSDNKIERFIVMKLNLEELELYNPKVESVLYFLKN